MAAFDSLAQYMQVVLAVDDIGDDEAWRAIFCLLMDDFPVHKSVRICDYNQPAIDEIYFLQIALAVL